MDDIRTYIDTGYKAFGSFGDIIGHWPDDAGQERPSFIVWSAVSTSPGRCGLMACMRARCHEKLFIALRLLSSATVMYQTLGKS